MDYEKKYKDAKEWIESIYPNLSHEQQMEAEAFFPELKESENEKIRKTLIEYFNAYPKDYFGGLKKSYLLAWLEKQGEQKPDWSIKEKLMLNDIIETTERSNIFKENYQRELIDWLKSLKQRYTWKPSDEQITVLELASKYERVFTPKQIGILIDLKEQLKKLKEG